MFYTAGILQGETLKVQAMRLQSKNLFSIYDSNKLHLDSSEWSTLRVSNLVAEESV